MQDAVSPTRQLEAKRQCGDCSMCCKVLHIDEVPSRAFSWCKHADPGGVGCTIYDERPPSCRAFVCLWAAGLLSEDMKPNKSGVVATISSDGERFVAFLDARYTVNNMPAAARQELIRLARDVGTQVIVADARANRKMFQ